MYIQRRTCSKVWETPLNRTLTEELDEMAEDLDTDQILALAAEEEERCQALEESRHEEEEELLWQVQQWQEALQKLKALHSKRVSLERSLTSATASLTKKVSLIMRGLKWVEQPISSMAMLSRPAVKISVVSKTMAEIPHRFARRRQPSV